MLKSKRLATIPLPDLTDECAILDTQQTSGEYDAFTFGSWSSHILANGSGSTDDTAFRPHDNALVPTDLGRRLPNIMRIVTDHFATERLQWVRVFALQDGILAPHVDFLEFDRPGVRLQVPLRTTTEALHSENDLVYHLRRGEVWQIHTTVPHSARSGPGPGRLSLCLDFAGDGFHPAEVIRDTAPTEKEIHLVDRQPPSEAELEELVARGASMTPENMRGAFRAFAALHFERAAGATDTFDWFLRAAERSGSRQLIDKAVAFRRYCIEKRAYKEGFSW
ncbi:putative nonproteinogenic amino acid hydroxylase [Streptomyces sp. NBRC 109706]|uniref:putative nonproteinogenic amino acid hydroxylase n=1 Tax=Streptomyces sp. NBRC 109706 TaxID=1550035 RepID=UPI000784150D|nr:putative nonproteinogenic amino acid hydroxylase [Streptomyces sp. NBRC 109706]